MVQSLTSVTATPAVTTYFLFNSAQARFLCWQQPEITNTGLVNAHHHKSCFSCSVTTKGLTAWVPKWDLAHYCLKTLLAESHSTSVPSSYRPSLPRGRQND